MHRNSANILFLASVLLCSPGCGHGHGDHGRAEQETGGPAGHEAESHVGHEPEDHEAAHAGHGAEPRLALDDGKKWPVDEHTRASAARLAALAGEAQSPGTAEDARALGAALDAELDLLVRNCTMTGPAHDQLHEFLAAFIPRVTALKDVTEVEEAGRIREQIGSLLDAYAAHFEG